MYDARKSPASAATVVDADLIATAHAMADAARAPILKHFRAAGLEAENKLAGGFDPVTEADRGAERAMRRVLADRRPNDAILGEEEGASPGTSGLTWVLDPVDGTRAFICGAPTFGALISLHDGRRPVLGVIDQAFTEERVVGVPGDPAFAEWSRGGERRRLATRVGVDLAAATVMTTFPEVGDANEGAAFRAVAEKARLTRYGLDCYAYALVALGHVDLVIEAGLNAYDIQAPIAVVEAAGGVVTDWSGAPCDQGGRAIAAGSHELHQAALELLAPFVD